MRTLAMFAIVLRLSFAATLLSACAAVTEGGPGSFSSGGHRTCAIEGGAVRCWGLDPCRSQRSGTLVAGVSNAAQVSVHRNLACVRRYDGRVLCWGATVPATCTHQPRIIEGVHDAIELSVGAGHACALERDGRVLCWGANESGQLGDGTHEPSARALQVQGLQRSTQLSAGTQHTCATSSDGAVWCWGRNNRGQLGDGSTNEATHPVRVQGLEATQVAAGYAHTCAITTEGTAVCWGANSYGELGDGTTNDRIEHSIALRHVDELSVGDRHTCARTTDGTMWCWGGNFYGQLGFENTQSRCHVTEEQTIGCALTPTRVSTTTSIETLSLGLAHTCVRTKEGTLRCWGFDYYGQTDLSAR